MRFAHEHFWRVVRTIGDRITDGAFDGHIIKESEALRLQLRTAAPQVTTGAQSAAGGSPAEQGGSQIGGVVTVATDRSAAAARLVDCLDNLQVRSVAAWDTADDSDLSRIIAEMLPMRDTFEVYRLVRPRDWWRRQPSIGQELAAILRTAAPPVAILTADDALAAATADAIRTIPTSQNEPSVGGPYLLSIGNDETTCELAEPSISSLDICGAELGYRAAAALDRMMNGEPAENILVPPGSIVERESTGLFGEDAIVSAALQMIRCETTRGIHVAEVVAALPVSRRGLETRFRDAVGHTVHEEIMRHRLMHACGLLRSSDLKISAVAHESGFGSSQRFFEVFRTRFAMTPVAYRSVHRAKNPATPPPS